MLCERMLHPTDYETAVHYFLEEFGGDGRFVMLSERDDSPALLTVLGKVASAAMGRSVTFGESKVFQLREHNFYHGNATMEGRVILFFYFKSAETGIAALIPGVGGAMEVARFRFPSALIDPTRN